MRLTFSVASRFELIILASQELQYMQGGGYSPPTRRWSLPSSYIFSFGHKGKHVRRGSPCCSEPRVRITELSVKHQGTAIKCRYPEWRGQRMATYLKRHTICSFVPAVAGHRVWLLISLRRQGCSVSKCRRCIVSLEKGGCVAQANLRHDPQVLVNVSMARPGVRRFPCTCIQLCGCCVRRDRWLNATIYHQFTYYVLPLCISLYHVSGVL